MFSSELLSRDVLCQKSFNLRWAEVGSGVIPLTAADPDFRAPEPVLETLAQFARDGCLGYGPKWGHPALIEAIATDYFSKRSVQYQDTEIFVVASAARALELACETLLRPGDEAIIFDPVDFLFKYSVERVGARAVPFALEPQANFWDFDQIEEWISPQTRLLCLCNPVNPLGRCLSRSEIGSIVQIAQKYDLKILSDEVWSDILFEDEFVPVSAWDEDCKQRTIVVHGMSKSYGLAGLRVGYLLCSDLQLMEKFRLLSGHGSTAQGVPLICQMAAATALRDCQPWLVGFLSELKSRRDQTIAFWSRRPGIHIRPPSATFVAFLNVVGTGKGSAEFTEWLLREAQVALVPGLPEWFGAGALGHVRLSFATGQSVLEEAFSRIEKAWERS